MRRRFRDRIAWAIRAAGALLTGISAAEAGAQANCNVNRTGTCQDGGTATFAMNLTISAVVRLTFPGSTIAFGTATAAEFSAGFGNAISVPVSLQANTGWAISISGPAPLWSAAPASARQNKPVGDLRGGPSSPSPHRSPRLWQP